jgi:hypothetical protein
MPSVLDFLTESTWIKGSYARTALGITRYGNAPDACEWCLDGALQRFLGDEFVQYVVLWSSRPITVPYLDVLFSVVFPGLARDTISTRRMRRMLIEWNDEPGRTFAEVADAIRKAESLLQAANSPDNSRT